MLHDWTVRAIDVDFAEVSPRCLRKTIYLCGFFRETIIHRLFQAGVHKISRQVVKMLHSVTRHNCSNNLIVGGISERPVLQLRMGHSGKRDCPVKVGSEMTGQVVSKPVVCKCDGFPG